MRGRALLVLVLLLATPMAGLAGADPSPERVLVSFQQGTSQQVATSALATQGVAVQAWFDAADVALVEAPAGGERLDAVPGVVHVTEDEPLDRHLASSKPAAGLTSQMQSAGLTGDGVTVAMVDGGVDAEHPGLDDRIITQRAVSEDGIREGTSGASPHGTHVAGILVGTGEGASEDREDVTGVAPGAEMVSLDISEQFTTSNALRAFEWVYDHHEEYDIRVLTNAWGRDRDPATYEPDDPLVRASDALVDDGVLVVFSAGNQGPDEATITVEGANPNVLTVGASDDDGDAEAYSSRGPVYHENGEPVNWTKPDLVAPGSHVVSTRADPGDRSTYVTKNGTSMAAPHAAGAATLLLGLREDLSPSEVQGVLLEGAGASDAPTSTRGHGMLDVSAAVEVLDRAGAQVEERSRTQEMDGSLTGPAEVGEALTASEVDGRETLAVEVPANATELAVTAAWDGGDELEVRLEDPNDRVQRTAHVTGEESLALDDPDRGRWAVVVEPSGPDRGRYDVTVEVTWLEEKGEVTIPVARQDSGTGAFPSAGSPLDPTADGLVPGVPNAVPMAAGTLVTVLTIVGRLRRQRTEDADPSKAPATLERGQASATSET